VATLQRLTAPSWSIRGGTVTDAFTDATACLPCPVASCLKRIKPECFQHFVTDAIDAFPEHTFYGVLARDAARLNPIALGAARRGRVELSQVPSHPNVIRRSFEPHGKCSTISNHLGAHTAYRSGWGTLHCVDGSKNRLAGFGHYPRIPSPQLIQKGFHVEFPENEKEFNQTPYEATLTYLDSCTGRKATAGGKSCYRNECASLPS
ncbi:hypothetical protein TNCV_5137441, partial [Trichonephila clavipes]